MRALAVLLVALAAAPAIAHAAPSSVHPSPVRLTLDAAPPDPMPVGAEQRITFQVQRHLDGEPVPGPGRVNLTLTDEATGLCEPVTQTVTLDPRTGQSRASATCAPASLGDRELGAIARSTASRPGTWNATLAVQPDELAGQLATGPAEGYRFPVDLSLTPEHLDRANLTVHLLARQGAQLGFQAEPIATLANGSTITRELVALHGGGNYEVHARAEGPLVHDWQDQASVHVPEPPPEASLALDVGIEADDAQVHLTGDEANEEGVSIAPGDPLTTRVQAGNADHVEVTVTREPGVELARSLVETGPEGEAEHTFAHEPLPAGPIQVQARAGNATATRNATVTDEPATVDVTGPTRVDRNTTWQGNLTLRDPNFGSTPTDPGPITALPDLAWTVYKGARYGSVEAESLTVRIGDENGTSNGTIDASRITWPNDTRAGIGDGLARLPVRIEAGAEAELRDYRLSLYRDGDLVASQPFELHEVDLTPRREPRAGQHWPVDVTTANVPGEVRLELFHEDDLVTHGTTNGTSPWRPMLPDELPADTTLRLEAHVANASAAPDALVRHRMSDRPASVDVHPVLDGTPARAPVPVHPAHAHEIELAYRAFDPNTGPRNLTEVALTGPTRDPGWQLDRPEPGLVRLAVPTGAPAGRYEVGFHLDPASPPAETVSLQVGEIVRLSAQGPDEVQLDPDEAERVDITVTNRGNVPVEAVRFALDTELAITGQASNGTARVAADEPLGVGLAPGETRQLALHLQAEQASGEDEATITVAGVLP
jgi:hypothetical protein